MLGLKSFRTATYILSGKEAMHMIKKKQVHQRVKSAQNQKEFIHKLFEISFISYEFKGNSHSMRLPVVQKTTALWPLLSFFPYCIFNASITLSNVCPL